MFLSSTTPRKTPAFSEGFAAFFYATDGRCSTSIATVRRQSIPSISNCQLAGVRCSRSSIIGGHTNRPFSSRLANRHSPDPSQYRIFM